MNAPRFKTILALFADGTLYPRRFTNSECTEGVFALGVARFVESAKVYHPVIYP